MAVWYNTKQEYKAKFQSEIKLYGFVFNEDGLENQCVR